MDYLKHYEAIMNRAHGRTYNRAVHELHHIVPRHIKKTKEVVPLTTKEHALVHFLRYKIWGSKGGITARDQKKGFFASGMNGPDFIKGKTWWNDGTNQTFSKQCPCDGYVLGRIKDGLGGFRGVWWNDGLNTVMAPECPGIGFVRGRILKRT